MFHRFRFGICRIRHEFQDHVHLFATRILIEVLNAEMRLAVVYSQVYLKHLRWWNTYASYSTHLLPTLMLEKSYTRIYFLGKLDSGRSGKSSNSN